jgi:TonB-dependent starch-binding outer membrane protein SusC
MKRILQITLVSLLFGTTSWAQDAVVKGKVTGQSGEALPGISVLLKGTTTGTITDVEGNYQLKASEGILSFSFIGYKPVEVPINNKSVVDVVMEEDVTTLSEIVVVGYGSQEKKDITGAVSVVSGKVFDSRPNSQFGNLIQGKTAGVQVLSSSGKPSEGFSIRIRGTSSISGSSEPLYVVDGVPSSDTRTINPADIENITVLKDASSTAIYGAQGANGVVLVTTKKGKIGAPKIEFSTYMGSSSVWKTLKVLNSDQYRDLMTELGQNTDWTQYTENTDWQNKVFQNGSSQNYQISISGKNDKTSYYLSGGWVKQIGAVRSSEMDRYNFKINLEQEMSKSLKIGTNLSYMQYHDVDVSDNINVNSGGVILGMLSTPSNIGVYRPNGTFTSNPFQDWENPLSGTDGLKRGYQNQRLLGNVYVEIKILPNLKFRSNVGIDYQFGGYDSFLDPFKTSFGRAKKGIGKSSTGLSNFHIFDNTLSFDKEFNKHHVTALVGSVIQKTRWENSYIEKTGYSSDAVTTTNAGSTFVRADNDKSEKTNVSFISRLTYDFNNKYLLTANFRADGSSSFGPNKRWGYFPSLSVGWRISEETFFEDIPFVNDLKIRAGWGLVGNDLRPYAYVGRVGGGANYPIGGVVLPGTYPASLQNNDLKWESTEQTNIGIDLAILNSRVEISANAYLKNTSDLLLDVPLPKSTGFDTGIQNAGTIENKGIELQISSKNSVKEFKWETDFNISFNRNKVINITGQQIAKGGIPGRGEVSYSVEGKPLGMFYGYISGGVDPATGMLYYIDKKGESTFTPSPDDRTFIGNPNPNFFYGITNTFSYKNFSLSIFLQGTQGNDVFNATRIETEGLLDVKNQSLAVVNRWRTPGDVTSIPKATFTSSDNSRLSTRFVENGSYLRAKAVTLSYSFPSSLLSKIHLSNARVYFTGENLFTITSYSGFDPEVNAFGGGDQVQRNTVQGVDFGTYPQTRNLIVGLNLSF